jgi:hypothetical protein
MTVVTMTSYVVRLTEMPVLICQQLNIVVKAGLTLWQFGAQNGANRCN